MGCGAVVPNENVMMQSATATAFDEACALISRAAQLLYANGQTTRHVIEDTALFARALGCRARVIPTWGELAILISPLDDASVERVISLDCVPAGVDMNKVARTLRVITDVSSGRLEAKDAQAAVAAIAQLPPVSTLRFAAMAAVGAAALGVIFGSSSVLSLVLIAISAGAGAVLRRLIPAHGGSVLLQPLCAALLAGLIAALTVGYAPAADGYLVALCPCMVLMPGPHFLNAALDFAHMRIPLGLNRFTYAVLLTLLICVGLIAGLSIGLQSLPPPGPGVFVPLIFDVLAAGLAVAAYGSFFSMPWRSLPLPMAIGMLAHACHWLALAQGANAAVAALVACVIVGTLVTPLTNRLHLPFAAFAFASVVSLIPGSYLFRMAAELMAVMAAGPAGRVDLLMAPFVNGTTAGAILLAMAMGLILPKLLMETLAPRWAGLPAPHAP